MWTHSLRERLANDQIVVGLTVVTPSVEAAAHAARLGFHFLWVEMEHSPITLESLRLMVLANRGLPAPILARVPLTDLWTAKRVLDQGVSGVIFPFTSSPELAQKAASACRYPPLGKRGSGAGLATATWPAAGNYYDSADQNILCVVVIEDRPGLEAIDAIAAIPEIDVIFIGTSDLAFSLGCRGDDTQPIVEAAIQRIADAALRNRKCLGRPAVASEKIEGWRQRGFRFFQAGTELGLMTAGAKTYLGPLGIEGVPASQRVLY